MCNCEKQRRHGQQRRRVAEQRRSLAQLCVRQAAKRAPPGQFCTLSAARALSGSCCVQARVSHPSRARYGVSMRRFASSPLFRPRT